LQYIDNFFAGYPDFPYEPTNSAMAEFYRLCNFFGWEKEDNDRKVARNLHMDAMTLQFNHMYGTNVEDMACWWRLCEDLEITPIPKGLDACRNVGYAVPAASSMAETDLTIPGCSSYLREPRRFGR
jgi:hypothetical protein